MLQQMTMIIFQSCGGLLKQTIMELRLSMKESNKEVEQKRMERLEVLVMIQQTITIIDQRISQVF